jgi:RNA polymerase sigma-70 factor (ECF subfamily)
MGTTSQPDRIDVQADAFEALRGRLFGLAYRMLGSRADAEDVVQEAYVRWHHATREREDSIHNAEAWLVTSATRLAIDRLRAARTAREAYSGPWLPDPLLPGALPAPDEHLERAADLSQAFLLLLERLAPEERAAFLLHDVFDASYADIARVLDRSEAACRQIVHRARTRVRAARRRFDADAEALRRLRDAFTAALEAQDQDALLELFAPDATWTADGGGVVPASPRPLFGARRLARLALGLQRIYTRNGVKLEPEWVSGRPGLVLRHDGRVRATFAFEAEGGRIAAVYVVLNPLKLPAR